ncbi:MAG: hypothetical protein K6F63_03990 [Lachnospiraceae bacterium]|nr:hypothetical protein [Lachnospiraceae bacterium]
MYLGNFEEKKKGTNPLIVALSIIGALTVAFALVYAVYNLVSGNAYKDDDDSTDEFEEDEVRTE